MNANASPFVAALLAARHVGTRYERDPDREPVDLAQAYAAQAECARALRAHVAGWKVGFAPDGETPVAAPMFANDFRSGGARIGLPPAGPLLIEVELAFRLARDLPRRQASYSRDEVLDAVDTALIGVELIAGRVGESKDVPFEVWLADNMGNLGYVTGDETRDFGHLDLGALRCRLRLDGETVYSEIGHPLGDPVEPFRAWACGQCDELGGLCAGQIVTTGSLTGVTRVHTGTTVDADLENIGAVIIDIVQAS